MMQGQRAKNYLPSPKAKTRAAGLSGAWSEPPNGGFSTTADLKKSFSEWCAKLPQVPPDNPLLHMPGHPAIHTRSKSRNKKKHIVSSASLNGLNANRFLAPSLLAPLLKERFRTTGPASPIVKKKKPVVEMTLHKKHTKQHKNYQKQQTEYHSTPHRRTSCVGSMQHAQESSNFSRNAPMTDPRAYEKTSQIKGSTFGATSVSLKYAAATLRANIEKELMRYQGAELKKLFDKYDSTNSGNLNMADFEHVVHHLVVHPVNLFTIKLLFREINETQSGRIDFEEFRTFIRNRVKIDRANQKTPAYQDRIWTQGGVGRHRNSVLPTSESTIEELNVLLKTPPASTSTLMTPTRSRQNYFERTKGHHTQKHRKASAVGGYMNVGFGHDVGQDHLVSPGAFDAGCRIKPIGPASDPSAAGRRRAGLTKLSLALRTRNEELRVVFDEADTDGDGQLQQEEFVHLMERFLPGQISRAEVMQVMRIMDLDSNGAISFEEFSAGINDNSVQSAMRVEKTVPRERKKDTRQAKVSARAKRIADKLLKISE
jgi:Ca2+-binding EF-hand superfamily protein